LQGTVRSVDLTKILYCMEGLIRQKIAIVGSGISGLSAAWLLSQRHNVTVYESADRLGGHSHTIEAFVKGCRIPVDTGFIVYNEKTYPNLTALFDHLDVPTHESEMSFAVSLDDGRLEYSGTGLAGLFAQPINLVRPRFWLMLFDLLRFYRRASRDASVIEDASPSLGEYLAAGRYGSAFCDDHLLPMAAAIWSASPATMLRFPAAAFARFYDNHGLLQLLNRPVWRTVTGGSRVYVERLSQAIANRIRINTTVHTILRTAEAVRLTDCKGRTDCYDHVVLATHADHALAMLSDPSVAEHDLLDAFRYSSNLAVLHSDASFMPQRRAAWASWNYVGRRDAAAEHVSVTYWMNRLQSIATETQLFVTLNPPRPPRAGTIMHSEVYEHPIFDARAMAAQRRLWSLQGDRNTWFCGAYFGSGFHEDSLQAGLAVAEQLGGVRRPWSVPEESGRIVLGGLDVRASAPEITA
jgi:predicted NAD/FAD-binding protein